MQWSVNGGEQLTLMKDGDNFVVAAADNWNQGRATYYEHSNLAILRAYLDDTWGLSLPTLPDEGRA
jgi:hypothetical protein